MGPFRPRVFNAKIVILAIRVIVENQAPGDGDPVGRPPPPGTAALILHAHTRSNTPHLHNRTREGPVNHHHNSDANPCAKCNPQPVRAMLVYLS